MNPEDIDTELAIYQSGAKNEETADPAEIRRIMDKIIHFDKMIFDMKRGAIE